MIEIYTVNNLEWNHYLNFFEPTNNQLHYTSEYHQLFSDEKNEPILFVYKENSNIFFYPFIKRPVNHNYYDITSVFGYTGPITTCRDNDFVINANRNLTNYLYENRVVSELIRFNPINDNHEIFANRNLLKLTQVKDYIVVETRKSFDELFSRFIPRLRTQIRKAERNYDDLVKQTTNPKTLQKFFDLYKSHMIQLNASDYYLFNDGYFENLTKLVQSSGFLIYAEENEEIIAGLLVLNHNTVAYSHHNARDISKPQSSLLNKLFHWKAIQKLCENQIDYFLLGGGVTNDADDNLLKFKKDFGGAAKKLWLGKRIINESAYSELCQEWEMRYPQLSEKYSSYIDKFHFTS